MRVEFLRAGRTLNSSFRVCDLGTTCSQHPGFPPAQARSPGHRGFLGMENPARHNNRSLVSKSLKYQLNPLGLADFSSSYSAGISAHRLSALPPSGLGLAGAAGLPVPNSTLNICVSVSIIKCFFPPSRIYNPTVKLPSRLQAGGRGVFISYGHRGLQDPRVDRHLPGLPGPSRQHERLRTALLKDRLQLLKVISSSSGTWATDWSCSAGGLSTSAMAAQGKS